MHKLHSARWLRSQLFDMKSQISNYKSKRDLSQPCQPTYPEKSTLFKKLFWYILVSRDIQRYGTGKGNGTFLQLKPKERSRKRFASCVSFHRFLYSSIEPLAGPDQMMRLGMNCYVDYLTYLCIWSVSILEERCCISIKKMEILSVM